MGFAIDVQQVNTIRAGNLIDGTGKQPAKNALVIIEGSRIKEVIHEGKTKPNARPEGGVIDASRKTIMPGLMDLHVHYTINHVRVAGIPLSELQLIPITVLEAAKALRLTVEMGYTTIRDCGAIEHIDIALKKAIERGLIPGPRYITCGRIITVTGGHGDSWSLDYPDLTMPHTMGKTADGANEVRKAVREEIKAGADWIKLTHAGISSLEGGPFGAPQFTVDEMRAACEVAHKIGKKVCVHCLSAQAIKDSITAGVDMIEHGFGIDEEGSRMMVQKGMTLMYNMSTSWQRRHLGLGDLIKSGYPEIVARKLLLAGYEARKQGLQIPMKFGVKICPGSDATILEAGDNALELQLLVASGFSPMQAITSATKFAGEALGLETGTIEAGKLADIIIVDGNPLENISILREKNRILNVIKEGKVVFSREPTRACTETNCRRI